MPINKANVRHTAVTARILARTLPEDDCVVWQGSGTTDGYGQIRIDGDLVMVHRAIYEAEVGPIPEGVEIDHVASAGCRHRGCVKLAHLEPVGKLENINRASGTPYGYCHKGHELTEANSIVGFDRRRNAHKRECRTCRSMRRQMKGY